MDKRFFLTILFSSFFIIGCQQTQSTASLQNEIILLKEKCAQYIDKAKERIQKENEDQFKLFGLKGKRGYYKMTLYSKSEHSCITILDITDYSLEDENGLPEVTDIYYNEFTGQEGKFTNSRDKIDYEMRLDLLY